MKRIKKEPVRISRNATIINQSIVGQDHVTRGIVPYLDVFQAGLNPEGRPAGIFLLMGPTGTGKTATVQAVADAIHGNPKNILRIDCGEYQSDHEIAKFLGAPPGYLGHRETQPVINQMKLNQVMSERANIAIVLFDEVEKAAPALQRLLLGIMDRGILRLGDNTPVNFERTLIFMTSNLGAKAMARELRPSLGYEAVTGAKTEIDDIARFSEIGIAAAKKEFAPEFIGRIDAILTFQPLTRNHAETILAQQLEKLANHISRRLGERRVYLRVSRAAKDLLLDLGFSPEFGARPLKTVLTKQILQPLASLIVAGAATPGSTVTCKVADGKIHLEPETETETTTAAAV